MKNVHDEDEWASSAVGVLQECSSVDEAAARLGIAPRTLRDRFASCGLQSPGHYLRAKVRRTARVTTAPPAREEKSHRLMVELTRKSKTLEELCDALDCSPSHARKLIDDARAAGYDVHLVDGEIGRTVPPHEIPAPVDVSVSAVGEWQVVGVISDTHLGSRYCLRRELTEFVNDAYDMGVREILHPGDILDGCYRHGRWEVTHTALDDQISDLIETLPHKPDLSYHAIGGNHDETFKEAAGFDVGRLIRARFHDAGRQDFFFYGWRRAKLRVRGALFEMWHPRGSGAYAKSYRSQVFLRDSYGPHKPDVLLIGHYHTFNYCIERGVHALMCPTFQGGGSSFGKSLGGTPAIGGMVLSWRATENGTLRDFCPAVRSYYELEQPHELQRVAGVPVEEALYEPSARKVK